MIKKRSIPSRIFEILLVGLTLITHWLIFYFVIINSFKTNKEAARLCIDFPKEWSILENYKYVFTYQHSALLKAFKNSIVLTAVSIFFLVLVSSSAAYILQRRKGLVRKVSDKLIVAGLIVPAAIIPTYWVLNALGVANTLTGLILVEIASLFPFATMLYKGYIASLPTEMDEAAIIDGCSAMQLFTRIIFPLLKPITATVVILRSVIVYNDFQNPQYYMSGSSTQTVQAFVYSLKSTWTTNYGYLFAASIVVSLPLIILYLFLNKKILEGMTAGSVKG